MLTTKAMVVLGLLSLGSADSVQNQDGQGGTNAVYFKSTCVEPNCFFTADWPDWPDPNPYVPLATLELPAGNYLLTGKLTDYFQSPVEYGALECFLGRPDTGAGDWATIAAPVGQVLTMMVPMRLVAWRTRIILGCRLFGLYYDDNGQQQPIKAGVWGVKLIAERVSSIAEQK